MKKYLLLYLYLICFQSKCFSQELTELDSLRIELANLSKEKATLEKDFIEAAESSASRNLGLNFGLAGAMFGFIGVSFGLYSQYKKKKKANAKLEIAYKELSDTQEQLLRSEKMAAFGVMAGRLSHEILNPLNFVNNFSEMSREIIDEMKNPENATDLDENLQALNENLLKINEHGKRATSIVKLLQEHTTKGTAHEFFEQS